MYESRHFLDEGTLITPIARNVLADIHSMKRALGAIGSAGDFARLEQCTLASLAKIARLVTEGKIRPGARLRHSEDMEPVPCVERELRIGIFPTAANPLHWAHLLGGLAAMERLLLDKVIFVIARAGRAQAGHGSGVCPSLNRKGRP